MRKIRRASVGDVRGDDWLNSGAESCLLRDTRHGQFSGFHGASVVILPFSAFIGQNFHFNLRTGIYQ